MGISHLEVSVGLLKWFLIPILLIGSWGKAVILAIFRELRYRRDKSILLKALDHPSILPRERIGYLLEFDRIHLVIDRMAKQEIESDFKYLDPP